MAQLFQYDTTGHKETARAHQRDAARPFGKSRRARRLLAVLLGAVLPALLAGQLVTASRSSANEPDRTDDPPIVARQGVGDVPVPGAIRIGMAAPDFELTDVDGRVHRLGDYAGKGQIVVLQWYNPTCRFIVKYHESHTTMRDIYERFGPGEGVLWLAVNSGSAESGTAAPSLNRERAAAQGVEYPILLDSDGMVGRLYGAKVTPQFFLLDGDGVVRWIGTVDNDPSDRWLGKRTLLSDALTSLTNESQPVECSVSLFGCAVKYAPETVLEVAP